MNDPLASCGCKNTLSIGVYANDVVSGHNKHTHTHTHYNCIGKFSNFVDPEVQSVEW